MSVNVPWPWRKRSQSERASARPGGLTRSLDALWAFARRDHNRVATLLVEVETLARRVASLESRFAKARIPRNEAPHGGMAVSGPDAVAAPAPAPNGLPTVQSGTYRDLEDFMARGLHRG